MNKWLIIIELFQPQLHTKHDYLQSTASDGNAILGGIFHSVQDPLPA